MRVMRSVAALAALLALVSAAQAGTIESGLQDKMERAQPGSLFSVIVHLTEQAPVPQLTQELNARSATLRERHQTILTALQQTAQTSQGPLRSALELGIRSGAVVGYTGYWISNLMVVQASKEEIGRIAARPDVSYIESNFEVSLIEPVSMRLNGTTEEELAGGPRGIGVTPGLRAIRAPEVWYQLGYTGAGRLVANLDTGVEGTHPALNTRWRGYQGAHPWQECWLDVLGLGETTPQDHYGHGTHVMGTETGLGAATQDTVGVAWGAQWIACNAINQGVGTGFDQDIITAYQWFADPDGNPNTNEDVPDVVQNSWRINEGFGNGYTDCDSRWWNAIDNCEAMGVVTTWSAGNEGPGGTTIGSPPDRATTFYNATSVGAVDATNFGWPYPIAGFSSRGPTGCNVPAERKIKPEVAAPGVDVYSSVPGGGYQSGWSGTSMAGPHVAGIIGLLREANPNLGVDEIKQILMDTARDEGTAGEDNTFGWGFVDAYDAVVLATVGFGSISGTVTNGSYNNLPIGNATVTLTEIGADFDTDSAGYYEGNAPAGSYTAEATADGFAPSQVPVNLISGNPVVQDFSMTDNQGPVISNVTDSKTSTNTVGPYGLRATVTDPSSVSSSTLVYRVNQGGWHEISMTGGLGGSYIGYVPGQPTGNWIDYYIRAEDGAGLTSTSPGDAPAGFYTLYITTAVFADNVEQDNGWSLSANGDNATSGLWVRGNPVGSYYQNILFQMEDDHTTNPATDCFATGNGQAGGQAVNADVDNGCTTLTTPTFNVAAADQAFVSYYRWWAQELVLDDEFVIDVSSNNGTTWVPLERVSGDDRTWRKVTFDLGAVVNLTANMKIRFKACDLIASSLIDAGIDDFSVETFTANPAGVENAGSILRGAALEQNQPNPFNPVTTIAFTLSNAGPARLEIFDASGRLVRTLVDRPMMPGSHQILWDGMDADGHSVGSGVYFYRLRAGAFEQSRRMTILK